ncbi:MAG: ABC transporter permease subunit [Candidatus Enteromonas sp.]|nr:ABC transporter permease subunit [Candidatus Enteromonas sp.]
MENAIKRHRRRVEERRAHKALLEALNPQSPKDRFFSFFRNIWAHKFFYLILIPSVVLLLIFAYQPMYGIVLAFKKYSPRKGILGSDWVGFANFEELFAMEDFGNAFKNTVVINLLKLVFGFPASIILAIMLNAIRNKFFKNTLQTIVYLPHFVSWVVVAGLIMSLFNERSGSLYRFFSLFGEVNVFGNGPQAIALIVISDIWKEVGWGAIIYLAALSGISADLYEAAELDGANAIHQFFHVTLPQLMPTISIMLILRVGGIIGGGFDQIYNLFNGNSIVKPYVDVLDTFVYRYGIGNGQFAMATAIGLFENIINIVLLFGANQIVSLINKE